MSIRGKVFQAIGEASMCWSETPKGIFESSRAEKVGNDLLLAIKSELLGKLPKEQEIICPNTIRIEDLLAKGFNDCLSQIKKIIEVL